MTVLFVIATILFFLGVDWVYRRVKEGKTAPVAATTPALQPYPLRTPEGIFFTKSHTWLNLFPSGKVRLGVDDFVGMMLDTPSVSFLRSSGENIRKGDPIMTLEENGHQLVICSPISGQVLSVNDDLAGNPELLKTNLFSDGWAYCIKPEKLSELLNLLIGQETKLWMQQEFGRLRDFLAQIGRSRSLAPALLQDGGPPVAGLMKSMDDGVWEQFEQQFLQVHERNAS